MTEDTILFVYGTLRPQEKNADLIEGQWLGSSTTTDPYIMYGMDDIRFPYLIPANFWPDHPACCIIGDLVRVTPKCLKALDVLESHPDYYQRQPITVMQQGVRIDAQAYIITATTFENQLHYDKEYIQLLGADWKARPPKTVH